MDQVKKRPFDYPKILQKVCKPLLSNLFHACPNGALVRIAPIQIASILKEENKIFSIVIGLIIYFGSLAFSVTRFYISCYLTTTLLL